MESIKHESIKTIDLNSTRSDEEKVKEAIKKYSRQTKTYPPTEWWDWDTV